MAAGDHRRDRQALVDAAGGHRRAQAGTGGAELGGSLGGSLGATPPLWYALAGMQRNDNEPRPWRLDTVGQTQSKIIYLPVINGRLGIHPPLLQPWIDEQGINAAGDIWFIVENWVGTTPVDAPVPFATSQMFGDADNLDLVHWIAYVEVQWSTRKIRAKLATILSDADGRWEWCVTDWLYLKTVAQRDKRQTLIEALREATSSVHKCRFNEASGARSSLFYSELFDIDTGFHGL